MKTWFLTTGFVWLFFAHVGAQVHESDSLTIDGKTIPEAFKSAQTYMRKRYPGQPYLWGGFVLIT